MLLVSYCVSRLSFYLNLSTILNKIPGTKHPHESNGLKFTLIKQLFNNNEQCKVVTSK